VTATSRKAAFGFGFGISARIALSSAAKPVAARGGCGGNQQVRAASGVRSVISTNPLIASSQGQRPACCDILDRVCALFSSSKAGSGHAAGLDNISRPGPPLRLGTAAPPKRIKIVACLLSTACAPLSRRVAFKASAGGAVGAPRAHRETTWAGFHRVPNPSLVRVKALAETSVQEGPLFRQPHQMKIAKSI